MLVCLVREGWSGRGVLNVLQSKLLTKKLKIKDGQNSSHKVNINISAFWFRKELVLESII